MHTQISKFWKRLYRNIILFKTGLIYLFYKEFLGEKIQRSQQDSKPHSLLEHRAGNSVFCLWELGHCPTFGCLIFSVYEYWFAYLKWWEKIQILFCYDVIEATRNSFTYLDLRSWLFLSRVIVNLNVLLFVGKNVLGKRHLSFLRTWEKVKR